MPTPFESAQLNLKLFELRRDPDLRQARAWFLHDFNPRSFAEMSALASGDRNVAFRMVLSYWEMACSLVTTGAIDADAFLAAHSEVVATFCKVEPFLHEARSVIGEPDFCRHLEQVVSRMPDAAATLHRRREKIYAAAAARAEARPAEASAAEAPPGHPA